MMAVPLQLHITLPQWLHDFPFDATYESDEDKVGLAIALSRMNVEKSSGGPFGAAIFAPDHRLISVGVNRVLPQSNSVAHAEMMAFMLAQSRLQSARINVAMDGSAWGPITLATSSQPCCQCFGASIWAGIDRMLVGARAEDVMALTSFDEGPLPADWPGELAKRGIQLQSDLLREAACEVLRDYSRREGGHY